MAYAKPTSKDDRDLIEVANWLVPNPVGSTVTAAELVEDLPHVCKTVRTASRVLRSFVRRGFLEPVPVRGEILQPMRFRVVQRIANEGPVLLETIFRNVDCPPGEASALWEDRWFFRGVQLLPYIRHVFSAADGPVSFDYLAWVLKRLVEDGQILPLPGGARSISNALDELLLRGVLRLSGSRHDGTIHLVERKDAPRHRR